MSDLTRLILVRHGETLGESSIRFHGSADVPLSPLGEQQARIARQHIPGVGFDRIVSSPLQRAWKTAFIAFPRATIHLEENFREIHFGRWEGLTKKEIAGRDPALFDEWQTRGADFDFPDGEPRAAFRARVRRGLQQLRESKVTSAVVLAHKGVVRALAEALVGESLAPELPALGQVIQVTRRPDGHYAVGRRSSNPHAEEILMPRYITP